ncbi:MAG TPA: hypothetical protein VNF49_10665, partial [Candidatus Binataceae bacterium]|nr:hypothetical protein [Candidatus Binataceae bacterium]
RLDPSEYGGAPLLGLNGVTIIAHGSSNPHAIRNAIRAAANEALVERVNAEIAEMLGRHPSAAPAKPVSKGLRALLGRMRERLHRHPRETAGSSLPAAPSPPASPAASPRHPGAPSPQPPAPAEYANAHEDRAAASADHAAAPPESVQVEALEPAPAEAVPSPNGIAASGGGAAHDRREEEGEAPDPELPDPRHKPGSS